MPLHGSPVLRPLAPADAPPDLLVRVVDPADPPDELAAPLAALGFRDGGPPAFFPGVGPGAARLVAAVPPGAEALADAVRQVRHRLAVADEPLAVRIDLAAGKASGTELVAALLGTFEVNPATVSPRTQAVAQISVEASGVDVDRAVVVAREVARARDWVNAGPSALTPELFAEQVRALAEAAGVEVEVWQGERLVEERMSGLLAVGASSVHLPALVRLRFRPSSMSETTRRVALVGKGITFDSGGLALKPMAGQLVMKCDMAGAATVAAAILATAELGGETAVDAYLCLAENMPGELGARPGDVLTMRDGTTVEISNTDAEGRLVLADGLCLAAETAPDAIVDVATLTGAVLFALGERTAGIMGSDASLVEELRQAGSRAVEPLWELPVTDEVRTAVTSSMTADLIQHNESCRASTIYAAAFLERFVPDIPWAHLDIAGTAWHGGRAEGSRTPGGTGAGVLTLVEWLGAGL